MIHLTFRERHICIVYHRKSQLPIIGHQLVDSRLGRSWALWRFGFIRCALCEAFLVPIAFTSGSISSFMAFAAAVRQLFLFPWTPTALGQFADYGWHICIVGLIVSRITNGYCRTMTSDDICSILLPALYCVRWRSALSVSILPRNLNPETVFHDGMGTTYVK